MCFTLAVSTLLHEDILVVTSGKQFSKDAACSPEIDLDAVVSVAIQQLRGPIVPCRDVGHTASGQRLSPVILTIAVKGPIVVVELLRAAEVADFQGRLFVGTEDSIGIYKDVVGLDIPVSDAHAVEESQSFEELEADLFEHGLALRLLQLDLGLVCEGCNLLPAGQVEAAHAAGHVVADQVQVLALLTPTQR